jgi:hypothetical protein
LATPTSVNVAGELMVADGSSSDLTIAELPRRWDDLTRCRSADVADDARFEMAAGVGCGWPQLRGKRSTGCGHGIPMPLQRARGHAPVATGVWPATLASRS